MSKTTDLNRLREQLGLNKGRKDNEGTERGFATVKAGASGDPPAKTAEEKNAEEPGRPPIPPERPKASRTPLPEQTKSSGPPPLPPEGKAGPRQARPAAPGAKRPAASPPRKPAAPPNPTVQLSAADLEMVDEPSPTPRHVTPPELKEDRDFYLREAETLARSQPERAAMMWVEAARVAEHEGLTAQVVTAHLATALQLAPGGLQVVSLVRRLMLGLGQYDEVLRLTEDQVTLGGDNADRAAALIEAAAVARHHRGDHAAAIRLLERALEVRPGSVIALAMKAAVHQELSHGAEAAASLEQLAESLRAPQECSLCLYAAGTIHEMRLSDHTRAEQSYAKSIELDPENLVALLALRDLHEQTGSWRSLTADLEQLAALQVDTASRGMYLLRAGSLHLDRTGDLEAAARTLAGAAAAMPGNPAPLTRLAHVYEATGRHEELIGTLRELLPLTLDVSGRAALLTRIGWLIQSSGGDVDRATAAYRQALELRADHLPALQALGTIFRQRGDYESLLAIQGSDSEGLDSAERRAARFLGQAELLANRLHRTDEAIAAGRRALQTAPHLPLTFWRLRTWLRREERHAELAALQAAYIERAADSKTRAALTLSLARLQAGPLQAVDQAVDTLLTARKLGQTRCAAIELCDLYERLERYADLVELLLAEANDTTDGREAMAWRLRAAAILDEHLGETLRALELHQEILAADPENAVATPAAGRIYHRLGRWRELVELHRQELETDPGRPDAPALWCRVGRLYDENLGHPADAIEAYTAALRIDPSCTVALDALERLLRAERRFEELADVLAQHADARREPHAAADALCGAAEVADARLGDLRTALGLYEKAVGRGAAFSPAAYGLLRAQLRQEMFAEAAATLARMIDSAATPLERCHLELELLRLSEHRLGQLPEPALYDAVARSSPYGSRLRAEQLRVRRLRHTADFPEFLSIIGLQTLDSTLAAAYLLESSYLHEFGGAVDNQVYAAQQAFARCPDDPAVLRSVQRATRAACRWPDLAALHTEEAQRETDPAMRLCALGQALAAHLRSGQLQLAADLARRCLTIDRHHLPSLHLLSQLAATAQSWTELAAWQDQLAESCANPANRLQACLRAAEAWEHGVGNISQALSSVNRALADDACQTEAFDVAARLLRTTGDHFQLSQLYERRIRACSDSAEKTELLHLQARLLRDKVKDAARAIVALSDLLALAPDHEGALSDLAELLCAERRWADAATTLARLGQGASDPGTRRQARAREATIWLDSLHSPARARQVLQQALDEAPGELSLKQLMVRIAFAEGQWNEVRRLIDEIAAEDQPALQAWAMVELAEVARVGLRDESLREHSEHEALTLAARYPETIEALVAKYRERGLLPRLVDVGRRVAKQLDDPKGATPLRLALAQVLLKDVGQPGEALAEVRDVLALDSDSPAARLLLAESLERQGEVDSAVESYRHTLDLDALSVDAYRGLDRLLKVLGHPRLARAAASIVGWLGGGSSPGGLSGTGEDASRPSANLDFAILPGDPQLRPMRDLLALLVPHLGAVYPLVQDHPVASTHPLALAARPLALSLGLSGVMVSVEGDLPAMAGVGDPVPLCIAPRLASTPGSAAFRFWAARALASAVTAASLLERLSDAELRGLLDALFNARPEEHAQQQRRKQLQRALPRKVRKEIEQISVPRMTAAAWARLRVEETCRADMVGLLFAEDAKACLSELAAVAGGDRGGQGSPRIPNLLRFAVSELHEACARQLWGTR